MFRNLARLVLCGVLLVGFVSPVAPVYAKKSTSQATSTKKSNKSKKDQPVGDWRAQINKMVTRGGVYAENEKGYTLFSLNADTPFVPASTLKLATASAALDLLGPEYRFPTDFYLDRSQNLWIKGTGDPLLVSSELAQIAKELRKRGLSELKNIYLDNSFFQFPVAIPGASTSLNPYDAQVGALLANFGTIAVVKPKKGEIKSAEPETPTTPLTALLGSAAPVGTGRINTGAHPKESVLYVGELLRAFLEVEGIPVHGAIALKKVPAGAIPYYQHLSKEPLDEILHQMLKHSTNFVANSIFLHLGAKLGAPPATLSQSSVIVKKYFAEKVGLSGVVIEEGSGLSRNNKITPKQLVTLLRHFEPHRELLKERKGNQVKTGTLKGVYCLAGYFKSSHNGLVRFAILLNQGSNRRDQVADLLKKGL